MLKLPKFNLLIDVWRSFTSERVYRSIKLCGNIVSLSPQQILISNSISTFSYYSLQFLKKMLMDRQNSMSSLFAMGNEVAGGCEPGERKAIEKQLRGLMQRFDDLTASAQQRMLDLEQAMKVTLDPSYFTYLQRYNFLKLLPCPQIVPIVCFNQ